MREYQVKTDVRIPRKRIREIVKECMVRAIRECAKEAFQNSQELCPVFPSPHGIFKNPNDRRLSKIPYSERSYRPGWLKREAYYSEGDIYTLEDYGTDVGVGQGAQIRYTAPYASFEERGFAGGVQHVGGYVNADGIYTKGYTRLMPTRPGVHFIERSLRLQIPEQLRDKFAKYFQQAINNEISNRKNVQRVMEYFG